MSLRDNRYSSLYRPKQVLDESGRWPFLVHLALVAVAFIGLALRGFGLETIGAVLFVVAFVPTVVLSLVMYIRAFERRSARGSRDIRRGE
jgi:hypothetical protein